MEASFEFDAEIRSEAGTRAARRLRRANKIPAVLYGGDQPAVNLVLAKNQVDKNLEQEAVFSHILTLKLPGDQEVQAILKEVQRHPSRETVIHLDFQRIKADEEIRVHVPLHFLHQEACVGVRKGGIVVHNLNEVEVSCLPRYLPEYLAVDLTNLDIGQTIHLGELVVPEGVTLVELGHEGGAAIPVVTIQPPSVEAKTEVSGGET
ncbi:MAG: 50S ribosomal protein L25/general stress protein Ctc [Methylohalobius sp.]|nr:50S ribosomal protein L25/general stress protein Ctc [Methylohalobius sp.]